MKDNRVYLIHIQQSIVDIGEYSADGRDTFMASKLIRDAVLHNLQVLAESTIRLPDDLKLSHPEVD